ncbi:MAG: ACT domain-containing protein [Anaerolineae bacterium]
MSETKVTAGGVMHVSGLCLVGVMSAPDRPGLVAAIFNELGRDCLNAQFIVQSIDLNNDSHVQFCVDAEDCGRVARSMQTVASELGARKVTVTNDVALISVFGPDFRQRPGIAGLAFGALAAAGINIIAVSTSISTVSCVVSAIDEKAALRTWQDAFSLQ